MWTSLEIFTLVQKMAQFNVSPELLWGLTNKHVSTLPVLPKAPPAPRSLCGRFLAGERRKMWLSRRGGGWDWGDANGGGETRPRGLLAAQECVREAEIHGICRWFWLVEGGLRGRR